MNVLIFVSSRERLWGREYSISRRTGQPCVRPASDLGPACPRNGLRPLPPMRRQAHCWFIPAGRRPAAGLKETKMTINLRDKTTARLLGSAFALALAASPLSLTLDRGGAHLGSHAAFAEDGGGSGSSGSGGGDSLGGSGSSGGDSGSGRSGGGDFGCGGWATAARGRHDDGGGGGGGGNDDTGQGGAEHVGSGGTRVEINGNDIEVVHSSGIKEEIENGRFEMKDASGRTIIERPATAADIARLEASPSRSGQSWLRKEGATAPPSPFRIVRWPRAEAWRPLSGCGRSAWP